MELPHAAIVGLGFMGRTHLQALRRLGVAVEGILGVSAEEGARFAQNNHVQRVYTSFDEITADPKVNVIHICTPNYLHYPMAKAALEHGKHVICEKPLAIRSAESGELVELAEKSGLAGVVNYNLRFYPLVQDARARVRAGDLGDVRLIQGGYLQDWLFLPTDWNWRLEAESGGDLRAVADIGTHWMDCLMHITGLKIIEVLADLATYIHTRYRPYQQVETFASKLVSTADGEPVEMHTEDIANLMFVLDNGARASVTISQISAGRKNHFWFDIYGSKASMSWGQENPNVLWLGFREKPNEMIIKDPALMHSEVRSSAMFPGGHAEGYPDTFYQLFQNVYSTLASGKLPDKDLVPTFTAGHEEILLCEVIQRSARERRWMSTRDIG
jgi:predicted dehydrogenase